MIIFNLVSYHDIPGEEFSYKLVDKTKVGRNVVSKILITTT